MHRSPILPLTRQLLPPPKRIPQRCASTLPPRLPPSQSDIDAAKTYCLNLLRTHDTPSYHLRPFIPPPSQTAYIAIRTFNLEIARIPDTVSTPAVGSLRLQFWRDSLHATFSGTPPPQPVFLLLHSALVDLSNRTSRPAAGLSKSWFLRLLAAREKYLTNTPFPTLDALESYAEHTYSTLLYLTLQSLPVTSLVADHVASHIGKAAGIAAVLRGIPLLAFPGPANTHSNSNVQGLGEGLAAARVRQGQGVVRLPLDVMAETGLKEEDVFRRGVEAEGFREAVFKVATRASDHLITARSMVANLRKGGGVGHEFEYKGEEERVGYVGEYDGDGDEGEGDGAGRMGLDDVERGFGVFMHAVPTQLWLQRLQRVDFDVFREEMRRGEWKLPWKAYLAWRRREF